MRSCATSHPRSPLHLDDAHVAQRMDAGCQAVARPPSCHGHGLTQGPESVTYPRCPRCPRPCRSEGRPLLGRTPWPLSDYSSPSPCSHASAPWLSRLAVGPAVGRRDSPDADEALAGFVCDAGGDEPARGAAMLLHACWVVSFTCVARAHGDAPVARMDLSLYRAVTGGGSRVVATASGAWLPGPGLMAGVVPPVGSVGRRLKRVNLVAACSFAVGGALLARCRLRPVRDRHADGQRDLPGRGLLLQSRRLRLDPALRRRSDAPIPPMRNECVGGAPGPSGAPGVARSCCSWGPCSSRSASVAAFAQGLTPRQSNGWIWLPDILGCVCFLVSGHLAMLDVGDGRIRVRPTSSAGGWWRSTSSARSCSSSRGSRPSRARRPTRRSTSDSSTGGRSPVRPVSRSAASSRHSTHPLRQERWFSHAMTQLSETEAERSSATGS